MYHDYTDAVFCVFVQSVPHFVIILQHLIPGVISILKCHMNIGHIPNAYGAKYI